MPIHGDRYLIDQEGASSSCIGFSLPERRPWSAFISGSDKISEALVGIHIGLLKSTCFSSHMGPTFAFPYCLWFQFDLVGIQAL